MTAGDVKLSGISLVLLIGAVVYFFAEDEVKRPPGVLVVEEPEQHNIAHPTPWEHKGYRITPLARFSAAARVLLVDRYWRGRESDLSPVDLTLGWRLMSDSQLLDKMRIYRGHRCYYWQFRERAAPAKVEDIISHSSNMHMIPGTAAIGESLKAVRRGHVVRFGGYLVEAAAADGWRWRSSLSRTDSGPSACEVVWVDHLQVE